MKNLLIIAILMVSVQAHALSKKTKMGVQTSMKSYVNTLIQENGYLPVVHEGKVLKLKIKTSKKYPDGFHAGVKSEGKLYASCADFVDTKGNIYDIDFLVSKNKDTYKVVQPIVHSINGKKNKYDLSH